MVSSTTVGWKQHISTGAQPDYRHKILTWTPNYSLLCQALGARPADIARRVYRSMLLLALPGLAIGTLLSFAAGRLVHSFLFRVSTTDTLTWLAAIGMMLVVVTAATIGPIRQSLSFDIARQLKQD